MLILASGKGLKIPHLLHRDYLLYLGEFSKDDNSDLKSISNTAVVVKMTVARFHWDD